MPAVPAARRRGRCDRVERKRGCERAGSGSAKAGKCESRVFLLVKSPLRAFAPVVDPSQPSSVSNFVARLERAAKIAANLENMIFVVVFPYCRT
jgi:hypothetical protein